MTVLIQIPNHLAVTIFIHTLQERIFAVEPYILWQGIVLYNVSGAAWRKGLATKQSLPFVVLVTFFLSANVFYDILISRNAYVSCRIHI